MFIKNTDLNCKKLLMYPRQTNGCSTSETWSQVHILNNPHTSSVCLVNYFTVNIQYLTSNYFRKQKCEYNGICFGYPAKCCYTSCILWCVCLDILGRGCNHQKHCTLHRIESWTSLYLSIVIEWPFQSLEVAPSSLQWQMGLSSIINQPWIWNFV